MLGRDAVARAAEGPVPLDYGEALLSLADVHATASRWSQALETIEQAIVVFDAKGATAYVKRGEERRQEIVAKRNTPHTDGDPAGP